MYKKYSFNENFFEVINTEEKAYWLGFLYADGNLSSSSNKISITLHIKDIDHLIKFQKAINLDKEVQIIKRFRPERKNPNQISCKVNITSKKMHLDLINKGCMPKKSFIIKFPTFLSKELTYHFIRGYFDGDGSVSWKKSIEMITTTFVCGSQYFLDDMRNFLGFGSNIRSKNKSYRCSFSSSEFYKRVIKNSSIFLDRKKEKFDIYFYDLLDNIPYNYSTTKTNRINNYKKHYATVR